MNFRSLRFIVLLICLVPLSGCLIPELIANAGPDLVVSEGADVTLKPTANILDYIVDYKWIQTAGPKVKFKVSKKGVLTFMAPETEVQQKLTFQLVVMYERGYKSKSDTVVVTVNQIKFFGTAPDNAADYTQLLTWFDQITPGNAGKWGSVEATRDVMNWTALDEAYNFAKSNGLKFKFHTLIWGQQQPGWINALPADEQLAEIDEWMAAVAERYPDIDLIDVVNEALNAPAEYRAALGGEGATGWDWVIKAFEMARQHFPKARLLINDYNTLILPQFTDNYLTLINLLKERGLIDGIGEQAHFLERAELPVVAANLDKLAATGLPIYISEFDLNFADDARQANVMRDLFTIFWDHPSVAGVTHWGYREGSMWRTNAYLLRADGSTRPAFDWINCYIAGGGDSCYVPEYVPQGWKGTEYGLTMEAEEYDDGEGIAALGNVVAYTDGGDWIAFKQVEFHEDWNKFWVTYAKGNTDPGSLAIHLDSRDSAPVLTVDLPPTAGWGSSKTLENDWPSIVGTHDIYVEFVGEGGIGNIDTLRVGKPQPESGVNLVNDGGFEAGIAGWNNWGNGTLSASTLQVHGGTQALRSTTRSSAGGFAAYGLAGSVEADTTYAVSAWVLHTGAAPDTVRLASKLSCSGVDSYGWLQNDTAVAPNTWTQLGGSLTVPADCTVTDAAIYFEGTAVGSDVFIDDVKVVPPNNNLVADGGFETGAAGWNSWGNGTLAPSTAQFHSGAQSLTSTARNSAGGFAAYTLGGTTAGTSYAVSAWVFVDGTTARLANKLRCGGTDTYSWLQDNTAVVPNTWTQLSGTLTIPADCVLEEASIYFENVPVGVNAYLDDVSVTPL